MIIDLFLLFLFISSTIFCKNLNYSVVVSAGDSITAGLGARWSITRPTLFVYEDCGVSFATGGDEDEDVVSIAKLIEEKFGTKVSGKSYGSRRINLCIDRPSNRVFCPRDPISRLIRRKDDGYNVALTGSTAEALPMQFLELEKRIEEDKMIKGLFPDTGRILLTLVIGANDLCMWDCRRPSTQLNSFAKHLQTFLRSVFEYFGDRLDLLIGEIPALEGIPDRDVGTGMEAFAVLECPCAYYKPTRFNNYYSLSSRIQIYNEILRNISMTLNSNSSHVFVSSALRENDLKDWPREMTSKLDGFHPSKWAHSYFAQKIFDELDTWDMN